MKRAVRKKGQQQNAGRLASMSGSRQENAGSYPDDDRPGDSQAQASRQPNQEQCSSRIPARRNIIACVQRWRGHPVPSLTEGPGPKRMSSTHAYDQAKTDTGLKRTESNVQGTLDVGHDEELLTPRDLQVVGSDMQTNQTHPNPDVDKGGNADCGVENEKKVQDNRGPHPCGAHGTDNVHSRGNRAPNVHHARHANKAKKGWSTMLPKKLSRSRDILATSTKANDRYTDSPVSQGEVFAGRGPDYHDIYGGGYMVSGADCVDSSVTYDATTPKKPATTAVEGDGHAFGPPSADWQQRMDACPLSHLHDTMNELEYKAAMHDKHVDDKTRRLLLTPCRGAADVDQKYLTLGGIVDEIGVTMKTDVREWINITSREGRSKYPHFVLPSLFDECRIAVDRVRERIVSIFLGNAHGRSECDMDPTTARFMLNHMRRHYRTLFPITGKEWEKTLDKTLVRVARAFCSYYKCDEETAREVLDRNALKNLVQQYIYIIVNMQLQEPRAIFATDWAKTVPFNPDLHENSVDGHDFSDKRNNFVVVFPPLLESAEYPVPYSNSKAFILAS